MMMMSSTLALALALSLWLAAVAALAPGPSASAAFVYGEGTRLPSGGVRTEGGAVVAQQLQVGRRLLAIHTTAEKKKLLVGTASGSVSSSSSSVAAAESASASTVASEAVVRDGGKMRTMPVPFKITAVSDGNKDQSKNKKKPRPKRKGGRHGKDGDGGLGAPTMHPDEGDDNDAELSTMCIASDRCMACLESESAEAYCQATGNRETVFCKVVHTGNHTVAREFQYFQPCDRITISVSSASFWRFELAMVALFLGCGLVMRHRNAKVRGAQHRRIARMVNA
eukprot:TRINITY_DN87792_c0_g1_i1.p1 TRINITY_DN87792_c0_g1~~TRINITY_DN87792_c0_g1_i1.p1  ORF type:complete len:282 (-),score=92.78 TRINITY_DN87792_c0_g1_i1:108-953(-)